jgi:hypothetical protein
VNGFDGDIDFIIFRRTGEDGKEHKQQNGQYMFRHGSLAGISFDTIMVIPIMDFMILKILNVAELYKDPKN